MTPFEIWMASINPATLANETFHSANHRAEMARHDAERVSRQIVITANEGRVVRHQKTLTELGEFWAVHDSRDTPTLVAVKPSLSESSDITTPRKEPVFTPEQIRIAQAVLNRKAS